MTYPRYGYAEDPNEDKFLRIKELENVIERMRARQSGKRDEACCLYPKLCENGCWIEACKSYARSVADDTSGVGACAMCGAPQEATTLRCPFCGLEDHAANCIVRKTDTLVAVCSDMNERVGTLERRLPRYPDSHLQIILDENVRKPLEQLFPELTGHPVEELIAQVKERLRCTGHPCCFCCGSSGRTAD